MSVHNPSLINIKDEGVSQGFVTELDFTGAGVIASVSGFTGTVNISSSGSSIVTLLGLDGIDGEDAIIIPGPKGNTGASGAGGSATRVVITASFPAKINQRVNIVDALVSSTSKVLAWISGIVDGLANAGDLVDVYSLRAITKTGSFDLDMDFYTPWAGSISIDYMIL